METKQEEIQSNLNDQWHWVTGSFKTGFKITRKKPRGKNVREPHPNLVCACRWVALQYSLGV
jgi:hypothetical protein